MSESFMSITPPSSYPPTPPNTADGHTRTSSLASDDSDSSPTRALSNPLLTSSSPFGSDEGRRPPRNVAHVNFGAILTQIQEENPGKFYELSTDVPDNSPHNTNEPGSPHANGLDLPKVNELLEELTESSASRAGSPAPSGFGDSVQSKSHSLPCCFK
ncbi:uncharacterized protein PV09_03487 [Verruconis gallopava]|uniref:Uncharacterized protein n=1 Tax=Verruconis gallopava TaxID=253628 RepID=A0A0D1XS98_9PEZI|nr:uncharacterized protein PV09_03487 [Verruconis gallopava]KIW05616.1 hypothetical protein PV09_03487 [Verruconis gallopava]